ncbi:MAG: uroporphyrinogen decarboxylase family protein [Anaerolineae bacterium]
MPESSDLQRQSADILARIWDGYDAAEIERRKQRVRNAWDYRGVDHIPLKLSVHENPWGFTMRDTLLDAEKQWAVNLAGIERAMRALPGDYIPTMRPDVGYMTMATVYGIEVHWDADPNQMPGIRRNLIYDMKQVHEIPEFDATRQGLMPECLRRVALFAERSQGRIYISGIDLGGPLNTGKDLIETNLFYAAFYEHPDEFHFLMDRVTRDMISCYDAIIAAAGGKESMSTTDFDDLWAPEQYKGYVSDDVCATISPRIFAEFAMPYNSRIFARYSGGLMHNCGPNPSAHLYLDHTPPIKGVTLAWEYSKGDAEALKKAFAGRGVIYTGIGGIGRDYEKDLAAAVAQLRWMADFFAPDVVVVPVLGFDGAGVTDEQIARAYWAIAEEAEGYARKMRWQ